MPGIRKRKDMRGKYELAYIDVDGRRHRIDTGTRDKKVAELWLQKAEELLSLAKLGVIEKVGRISREVVAGQDVPEASKRLHLDDFEREYLERGRHDLELADNTLTLHQCAFASLRSVVGNPFIDKVSAEDVRKWKRALIARKRTRTTVAIYHRMLKAAFSRAVKWKMIKENPFTQVEISGRKAEIKPQKSMDIEEVRLLLQVIQDQRFKRFVQFVLYTGCRRNEILYLKREDLDLDQRILYVQVSKTRRRLALPINKALFRVIQEMLQNNEMPDSGYIFRSESPRRGKHSTAPWHPHSVTHWFKQCVRKAGLPDHYSLHSCRHTYTTHLRSKGVPQDVIQRLLGHTSVRTTDIYDHSDALFFRAYADEVDFEEEPSEG